MIKDVHINDIYGELICKIDESQFPLLEQQGKYPRIQWISIDGRKLSKRLVKTEIVSIIDKPHYKFVQNDIISYQEYMNKNKWTNYGTKHSPQNFKKLIESFKQYLENPFENQYIKCKMKSNKLIIIDGLHRISIIKSKFPNQKYIKIKL